MLDVLLRSWGSKFMAVVACLLLALESMHSLVAAPNGLLGFVAMASLVIWLVAGLAQAMRPGNWFTT
jgi:hypothetical protein